MFPYDDEQEPRSNSPMGAQPDADPQQQPNTDCRPQDSSSYSQSWNQEQNQSSHTTPPSGNSWTGQQNTGWSQPGYQQPYSPFYGQESTTGGHPPYYSSQPPKPPRPRRKRTGRAVKNALKYVGVIAASAVLSVGSTFGILRYSGMLTSPAQESAPASSSSGSSSGYVPTTNNIYNGGEMSLSDVAASMADSVVGIVTTLQGGQSTGSGFVYSEDGLIITNYHVIENGTAVQVVMDDGTTYDATVVGGDEQSDLAVLKIDAQGLSPVTINSADTPAVGETVLAIGNPLGLELQGSVSAGIISAVDRQITVNGRTMNLLQTDASISPGNSGGPLVNSRGEVIGINSAKISSDLAEGLGFAIPMTTAMPIISDLIEYGYVTGRPVIGVSVSDVSAEMVLFYRMPQGVYVQAVTPGSSAETAGIEVGDIITAADGQAITSTTELDNIKDQHSPGDEIVLTIYRSGRTTDVTVVLSEYTA